MKSKGEGQWKKERSNGKKESGGAVKKAGASGSSIRGNRNRDVSGVPYIEYGNVKHT